MSWELARQMTMVEAAEFAEPFYPHVVSANPQQVGSFREIREWCTERFGECGSHRPVGYTPRAWGMGRNNGGTYKVTLSAQWLQLGDFFAFRDENAAFEFRMRWG